MYCCFEGILGHNKTLNNVLVGPYTPRDDTFIPRTAKAVHSVLQCQERAYHHAFVHEGVVQQTRLKDKCDTGDLTRRQLFCLLCKKYHSKFQESSCQHNHQASQYLKNQSK